ncbi:MAG TPA: hypothetical protein VFS37_09025 [Conexibacter sp.]|nr:hypothetical protein [Conexibacter sp.]
MSDVAIAVVFTYVPSEDRTYHTVFTNEGEFAKDDPLTWAHAFCEGEEEHGDFGADSIWTVTGNDAATLIRKNRLLASYGLGPDADAPAPAIDIEREGR